MRLLSMVKHEQKKETWDFAGNGFRGWLRWGEKKRENRWYLDRHEADIFRIPDEGGIPEWATLPEQDEGEL